MIIYGDVAQTKDFIYIDVLIQALIRTATYQSPQHSALMYAFYTDWRRREKGLNEK